MKTLPNLKDKQFGGAWSIHDPDVKYHVMRAVEPYPSVNVPEFLASYREWIQNGNELVGIEQYKYTAYANGTTETFDKFYSKYARKTHRLRLWRGEYFYHQIQRRENFKQFAWIDEDTIAPNDVVVVSLPFSDTGNKPYDYDAVMEQCCNLKVPVMIDMAYVSLSKNQTYNLDYPCIETITTSLSKVFPVEHLRIGIRLNRYETDDTLDAYTNQANPYVNTVGVNVGSALINYFNQNYVYDKWHDTQLEACALNDVEPSNCIIFGIDTNGLYPQYNRGGDTNRLCFSRIWDERV